MVTRLQDGPELVRQIESPTLKQPDMIRTESSILCTAHVITNTLQSITHFHGTAQVFATWAASTAAPSRPVAHLKSHRFLLVSESSSSASDCSRRLQEPDR